MFIEETRPIWEVEERRLRKSIRRNQQNLRELRRDRFGCIVGLLLFSLLIIAVKPYDPVNRWGALGMFGLLLLMSIGIELSIRREILASNRRIEQAIQDGKVVEIRISSTRCFRIPEGDDEGSDFHFDIGDQRTVLVRDYAISSRNFPSSELTLTRVLRSDGEVQEEWFVCRGDRLTPTPIIPRDEVPDDRDSEELVPIPGTLEDRLREIGAERGWESIHS